MSKFEIVEAAANKLCRERGIYLPEAIQAAQQVLNPWLETVEIPEGMTVDQLAEQALVVYAAADNGAGFYAQKTVAR